MTPLKASWVQLIDPIVEHMKLQAGHVDSVSVMLRTLKHILHTPTSNTIFDILDTLCRSCRHIKGYRPLPPTPCHCSKIRRCLAVVDVSASRCSITDRLRLLPPTLPKILRSGVVFTFLGV